MGIDWNPKYPRLLGVEYVAAGTRHETVDSPLDQNVLVWDALRTGEVDWVDLYAGPGTFTPPLDTRYASKARPMIVDLQAEGDEPYTISSTVYAPTAVTGIASIVNENLSTPVTVSRITTANDGLFMAAPAIGDGTRVQFDTAAFPLTRRVLSVQIFMRCNLTARLRRLDNLALSSEANPWFVDIPLLAPGGAFIDKTITWGEVKVDAGESDWTHWTAQDVRDFRAGGPRQIAITCRAVPGAWRLDQVYMRVFWTTENRVGLGINQVSIIPFQWNRFELIQADGSGSPSLTQGDPMSLTLRRIIDYSVDNVAGPTVCSWRHLRGYSLDPVARWESHAMRQTPLVSIDGIGARREGIAAARFGDATVQVEDTQPYEIQRGGWCYDGSEVYQDIDVDAGAAGTTYGQVYAFVGYDFEKPRPEAPLLVEVRNGPVGSGAVVFSQVQVTVDEVARLRNISPVLADHDDQNIDYRQVRLRFPESQTLPVGPYTILFTSPGTSQARAWRIGALISDDIPGDETFQGSSGFAQGEWTNYYTGLPDTLAGSGWSSDLQVCLAEVPAAVTGVGVAAGSLAGHHAEICQGSVCLGCADEATLFAAVTWSPAPSGSPNVASYQIDRMDDVTPWERVAHVDGRLTDRWEDMEVRLGVTSWYRVRSLRTDDVSGDWSDPVSILMPGTQVALSLSSNAATGMAVCYPEVFTGSESVREFEFLEAGDTTFTAMYGRDKQVAFRPAERRGDRFQRIVLLQAFCSVESPTRAIFHPLQDIAWAPIPYVCVRDGEGNRWYANVQVPSGNVRTPDRRTFAEIIVTEVAAQPHIQDTTVAQVTEPVQL
jgi:hypothetical protein